MNIEQVLQLTEAKIISKNVDMTQQINTAFSADLMSDVLTCAQEDTLLLTGLTNPQVVRTAEMANVKVIIFVRGKLPQPDTIRLAEEKGIYLLSSKYSMFETSGRLYKAGLPSCGLFEPNLRQWYETFGES